MNILIATGNTGKLQEYQRLFAVLDAGLLSLTDLDLGDRELEETGKSFEENASLKANTFARLSNHCTVADDSGLMVDALDGAPGIYSARYGGEQLDSAGRRGKLLAALEDVGEQDRKARFVCVIAIADPLIQETILLRGECPGRIASRDHDDGQGFGYDAVFIPDGYHLTFAQLRPELKDGLSHRARAAQKALPILHEICSRSP
ncbi:MAG: RdgB/HAM1 family non-canonical purine NTP pyrophosphatase [Chloroflexi bacterium]|nr:RdgB/HAM1 family non-canonical purine NTP pyrophosphatase [Chloroflexota bacterium]